MLEALNTLADMILAGAAIYTIGRALQAAAKDRQAERETDPERQKLLKEDALTLSALSTLQKPALLWILLVALVVKVLILAASLMPPE
jgi:hypothetical protein